VFLAKNKLKELHSVALTMTTLMQRCLKRSQIIPEYFSVDVKNWVYLTIYQVNYVNDVVPQPLWWTICLFLLTFWVVDSDT